MSRREWERVRAVGGDPHRRVGRLHRPRHHRQLARLKVFPVKRKGVVCPRRKNEVERLVEARAALLGRDAIARVVSCDTATDTEFKATVAKDVRDRRFLGDLYRAVQRQQSYRRAEANAAGPLGRSSQHHQRIGKDRELSNKMNLAKPHRIEADSIAEFYLELSPNFGDGLKDQAAA